MCKEVVIDKFKILCQQLPGGADLLILAECYRVQLIWVPGHGVANELADIMAKQETNSIRRTVACLWHL